MDKEAEEDNKVLDRNIKIEEEKNKVIEKEEIADIKPLKEETIISSSSVKDKEIEEDVVDSHDNSSDINNILNIDSIIDARVNNILAKADKKILKTELELFETLRDYSFDQEIGYLICDLLDGKVRAASSDGIIISYEFDSAVKQNLLLIEKLNYVYNKITNSNKDIAVISDNRWEEEKNKYIQLMKDGRTLDVVEIPKAIYEDKENNDIISNSAVELFGSDIVEVE